MFKSVLISAFVFGMVAIPPPGTAGMVCGTRAEVTATLASRYGETFRGGGFQPPDSVVEVWAAADTRTWSILVTLADHATCLVASGTNWVDWVSTPDKGFRGILDETGAGETGK